MSQVLSLIQQTPLSYQAKAFFEKHWLMFCLAIIVSVSIYDTYLVHLFRDMIRITERNPICLALIELDPTYLTWFYAGKLFGNICVVSVLLTLCRFGYRHHKPVVIGVAAFQFFLWLYLTISDDKTGILSFDGLLQDNPEVYAKSVCSLLIHLAVLTIIALVALAAWKQHRRSTWDVRQQAAL